MTTPLGGNQPSVCWLAIEVPGIIESKLGSPDRSRIVNAAVKAGELVVGSEPSSVNRTSAPPSGELMTRSKAVS